MAEVENKKHDVEVVGGGIVTVNPKPNKGLASKFVDWFEKLIVKLMYDSSQPLHYLTGNYAPTPHETPPTKDLPVIGNLPVSIFFSFPSFLSVCNLCVCLNLNRSNFYMK